MIKKISAFICVIALMAAFCVAPASAAGSSVSHTVASGDSMWKIAVKYQVGLSEIISANSQIKNPSLIYPGQVLYIPLTSQTVRQFEQEVIALTNQERAKNGLAPLTENWELSRVARYKSQDMADIGYFSHTSPTYGSPFKMITDFGISYRSAGENIAMGYATPEAVREGWMNSPDHRANILGSTYTQIGIGYVADGNYWTMALIG